MGVKRRNPSSTSGFAAKKARSDVSTPQSLGDSSGSEYDEPVASDPEDDHKIEELVDKYSVAHYAKKSQAKSADSNEQVVATADNVDLPLKPDHAERPLWIDPQKGRIIMESFSPMMKSAEELLINIAEPVSRVSKIHEYMLTPHSLFAAVSVGYTTDSIIRKLDIFCKTPLPSSIKQFIIASTQSFGKVRLVLKHTRYFVESSDPAVLQTLLRDPIIGSKRIDSTQGLMTEAAPQMGNLVISGTKLAAGAKQVDQQGNRQDNPVKEAEELNTALLEDEDDDEEVDQVHSFEIAPESVQEVSKRCRAIDLPMTEEYDFRNDEVNANLDIDLRPMAQIRPYQEQALAKMFGNGRARSGIIVLPCGAGKTLVGITAACTVKKGIFVLATSAMSVVQWRAEFMKWSNINPDDIAVFTADNKNRFPGNTGIIITTYSMVAQEKSRSHESRKVMDFIEQREWGLMLLDEVHVVPAEMFKKVTYKVKAHSKLGLTATLLREDDKIQDLNFLIGPKLYEANWQELSEQGHIAKVQCAEVWCPMSAEFYEEYLRADTVNKRTLLFTMNPRKFQACQFLINYHESRGDKIIVFSDNVYALKQYAVALGKPYIYGATSQAERMTVLENFQHNPSVNTLFLSKIGDTSLDLPEATCLIQVSSHYGSRRQEAQRLGRILRAKRRNDEGFNAFFYSLVSKDTQEMYYSSKRQAFLVDQGYAFKVITQLQGIRDMPGLKFATKEERNELMRAVLLYMATEMEQGRDITAGEVIEGDLFSSRAAGKRNAKKTGARRTAGMLSELSGGQGMAYVEYNKSKNKELKGQKNKFVQKLFRDQKKKHAA